MSVSAPDIAHHAALDARMVKVARGIRLLNEVSWPASLQEPFLESWRRGQPRLPKVEYKPRDFSESRRELDAIAGEADESHPLGRYIAASARNWAIAAELLEALGTPAVTQHSIRLFGRPDEPLPGNGPSTRDAARHFIGIASELDGELLAPSETVPISAISLQLQLQTALDDFFNGRTITVELDPDLIAKAAAGATRIRLRQGAVFNDYDRDQLLQHEAFVHSLTALNGREQPVLRSMELPSPRTTATQEGLATLSEMMSGSMDIERMKRISLRIVAIDKAIHGADFIEIFRFFLGEGQSDTDSFTSAQRVFRGVPLSGGAAFTKDTVYLHGLLSCHTFFRWCLRNRSLSRARHLFCGKMALEDVFAMEDCFKSGAIAAPLYLPPWVQRANGLAGMLAFSLFANKIRLDRVDADDLVLGL